MDSRDRRYLLHMNQIVRSLCIAAGILLAASSTLAQSNTKPLDRGIHKRKVLKGYTVFGHGHRIKRQQQSFQPTIHDQTAPATSMKTLSCRPVGERSPIKNLDLRTQVSVSPWFVNRLMRPLFKRQAQPIGGPPILGHLPLRPIIDLEAPLVDDPNGPPSSNEPKNAAALGLSIIGLAVGTRALLLGQRFGDAIAFSTWKFQGLLLGGLLALIGGLMGSVKLIRRTHSGISLTKGQRALVLFFAFSALAGFVLSVEIWGWVFLIFVLAIVALFD